RWNFRQRRRVRTSRKRWTARSSLAAPTWAARSPLSKHERAGTYHRSWSAPGNRGRFSRRPPTCPWRAHSHRVDGEAPMQIYPRVAVVLVLAAAGSSGAALPSVSAFQSGRAAQRPPASAGYRAPRAADGHADLNGIWQAMHTANWDIQDHAARQGPVAAR